MYSLTSDECVYKAGKAEPDIRMWSRRLAAFGLFAIIAFSGAVTVAAPAPDSFADLAEKVSPAVVNISTTQTIKVPEREIPVPQFPPGSPFEEFFKDFFDRRGGGGEDVERQATSLGSGFVLRPEGVIVTNNHVIADADEIVVTLTDGTEYEAEIVGRDSLTDIAILRVQTDDALPYLSFGDSDALRVGDWVMAIGNPYGLGGSVTAGIVSARSRNINMGPYDDFIQTDAAINRGNSGGPLIDMEGNVVGINSAIFSPTGGSVGIGFSIPSNQAKGVVADLLENGMVRRGWLGVSLQGMTPEIAESLGLGEARGALVARVIEGDPADLAGIQSGDVILEFDGKEVKDSNDLPRIVANTPVGKNVRIVVWRNGREQTINVTLAQRPDEEVALGETPSPDTAPNVIESKVLGMELAALDSTTRERYSVPDDIQGVVVTSVERRSDAYERGIREGVVIVQIGQDGENGITTPEEFRQRIADARSEAKKFVLLRAYLRGQYLWIPVQLNEG